MQLGRNWWFANKQRKLVIKRLKRFLKIIFLKIDRILTPSIIVLTTLYLIITIVLYRIFAIVFHYYLQIVPYFRTLWIYRNGAWNPVVNQIKKLFWYYYIRIYLFSNAINLLTLIKAHKKELKKTIFFRKKFFWNLYNKVEMKAHFHKTFWQIAWRNSFNICLLFKHEIFLA